MGRGHAAAAKYDQLPAVVVITYRCRQHNGPLQYSPSHYLSHTHTHTHTHTHIYIHSTYMYISTGNHRLTQLLTFIHIHRLVQ